MSKKKNLESEMQSREDNEKDAMNSKSGFKGTLSAGVIGTGSSLIKNKR